MKNLPVDDFREGLRIYGDIHKARQYEFEIQYYYEHGALPDDCIILERVENINGNLLIIHQDTQPNDA